LFHSGQIELLLVDASKTGGTELYQASTVNQAISPERSGVPRLVIGDVVLVGSIEIPEQTGGLVQQGLDQGGLEWPVIDGLGEALATIPIAPAAVAVEEEAPAAGAEGRPVEDAPTEESPAETDDPPSGGGPDSAAAVTSAFEIVQPQRPSMLENFRRDPVGNSFAVTVLLLMIVSSLVIFWRSKALPSSWGLGYGVPALALAGAVVATYLTYIEATGATAVCGPVGDCNTVNQSEYARLFGVVPVGALGLIGYVAVVLTWAAAKHAPERASYKSRVLLLAMTIGGTLFSIYLTFLEPFVIGATCAWCLTSAVVITVLMWVSAGSGRDAWVRLRGTNSSAG